MCLSCYNGFTLVNNTCIKSAEEETANRFCAEWLEGFCVLCSKGSVMDGFGHCKLVSPLCRTYDEHNGYCLSCYDGFELKLS